MYDIILIFFKLMMHFFESGLERVKIVTVLCIDFFHENYLPKHSHDNIFCTVQDSNNFNWYWYLKSSNELGLSKVNYCLHRMNYDFMTYKTPYEIFLQGRLLWFASVAGENSIWNRSCTDTLGFKDTWLSLHLNYPSSKWQVMKYVK
jgi:hypothetical protein